MHALTDATAKLFAPIYLREEDTLRLEIDKELKYFKATAFAKYGEERGGGIGPPTHLPVRHFFQRIPERKQLEGTLPTFEIGATDFTVSIINALWPKAQIEFQNVESRDVFRYYLAQLWSLDQNAERTARYKLTREVPEHSLCVNEENPLAGYQQVGLINSMESTGFGLFMEQGTGKTPIPIARICNEAPEVWEREGRPYRAIIVAPKNVRMNWENEFCKFATETGRVTVLRRQGVGRINDIIDAFTIDPDDRYAVVICSFEALVNSWAQLRMIEWDLGVVDEIHYGKTATTRRHKYLCYLRDRCRSRMALTGTPITNSMMDLYAELEFLGEGYSGFRSFKAFKDFYGVYEPTEQGFKALVGIQNAPFMQERLARMTLIVSKEEALPELPEKVYDVVEVDMTAPQKEVYNKVVRELTDEIDAIMGKEQNRQLILNNVLTRLLRLAQITSGFVVYQPEVDDMGNVIRPREVEWFDPIPKQDALIELLKEKGPDEKTLVWAVWREDLIGISERLKAEGMDHVLYYGSTSDRQREEAERRYNYDRDCRIFVGNPKAGGTGLNLLGHPPSMASEYRTNTTHEIYYSQGWSPTERSQSEDRGHRRGTRCHVRITDLCVPRTIDQEIRERVLDKRMKALEISNLSEVLRNVLQKVA